jgi:hypothetical protein
MTFMQFSFTDPCNAAVSEMTRQIEIMIAIYVTMRQPLHEPTETSFQDQNRRRPARAGNTQELIDIIDKMQSLSIREPAYAVLLCTL